METVTVTFDNEELQALGALLDAAVKATGIQGAKAALPLYAKLEAAVASANVKNPKPIAQESG
jgi:hypothetical protein